MARFRPLRLVSPILKLDKTEAQEEGANGTPKTSSPQISEDGYPSPPQKMKHGVFCCQFM